MNLQSPLCSLCVDVFSAQSVCEALTHVSQLQVTSPPAAVGGSSVVIMDRCVDCVSRSPAKLSFPAPSSAPPIKHIVTASRHTRMSDI